MISLFFEEFYIEGYVHIFRVRQEPVSLDFAVYESLLARQTVFHEHFDSCSRTPPLFEQAHTQSMADPGIEVLERGPRVHDLEVLHPPFR
jgi:hypothetical protein